MAYATTKALSDEVAARKAADAALQSQVDALKAAVAAFTPPPVITPVPTTVRRVTSLADWRAALLDDTLDRIVVAAGKYLVPDAGTNQSTGFWLDTRFAARTRPLVVAAEADHAVAISGGGATHWNPVCVREAHDMSWEGFDFVEGEPTQTGVIVFGQNGSAVPGPTKNFAFRRCTVQESVVSHYAGLGDHAMYFSTTTAPSTGIVVEDFTVNARTSGLNSIYHFYTQPTLGVGPNGVTLRRTVGHGTHQQVVFWDASLQNVLVDGATLDGATVAAVRYELAARGIVLDAVASTGSAQGLLAPNGTTGLTVNPNCSLN